MSVSNTGRPGGTFFLSLWLASRLARLNFRKNFYLSFLVSVSLLGVCLGVIALMVVLSVMFGLQEDIRSSLLKTTPHLLVRQVGGYITDYREVSEEIAKVRGVVSVSPEMERSYLLKTDSRSAGVKVVGWDISRPDVRTELERLVRQEKTEIPLKESVWVGTEMASYLFVRPGDRISLISSEMEIGLFGLAPSIKEFTVAGLVQTGFYEYDANFVYMDLAAMQAMENVQGVESIRVRLSDPFQAVEIRERIMDRVGRDRGYLVSTWQSMNHNLFTAIRQENIAMVIIISLVIMVASMNISSNLLTIVVENRRTIAILKAYGASPVTITGIFTLIGAGIGSLGTIAGWVIAMGIITYIKFVGLDLPGGGSVYYITKLPASLDWKILFLVPMGSFLLSLGFSWMPARRANRLEPAEVLRNE